MEVLSVGLETGYVMFTISGFYVFLHADHDHIPMLVLLTCTMLRFIIDDLMISIVMGYSYPYCAQHSLLHTTTIEQWGYAIACHDTPLQ